MAKGIWQEGPSILLNYLWTEERAPYILHSRDNDSKTVLSAIVWRQAWLATIDRRSHLQIRGSSVDRLVMKFIQDGSDVYALSSPGSTPLNNALRLFVTYCDSSPLKALGFAHESREVFQINKVPPGYGISGPQSGSGADLDRFPDSKRLFGEFLYWWFERLQDSGYGLNDYVRQEETPHPPMCKIGRDNAVFSAKISKTIRYDKTAHRLELDMRWAWTKIGDSKDIRELWFTILHF